MIGIRQPQELGEIPVVDAC